MQHCLDAITIVAIGVAKEHKTEIFEITTLRMKRSMQDQSNQKENGIEMETKRPNIIRIS